MKFFFNFFILFLFFLSITYAQELVLKEIQIRPGQVELIKFFISNGLQVKNYSCAKAKLPFEQKGNVFQSFVMASYFMKPGKFVCEIELAADNKIERKEILSVSIVPYQYKKETLKVAPKTINLSKKDLARYEKERKILDSIYGHFSSVVYFEDKFLKPSDLPISSVYGTKRVFNNVKSTQHLGTDFRAPMGTPVLASNKGKVVLAEDLFFSGNTILIDHGLSLFTMYAHLSKIDCKVGDVVEKGALIGHSGNTGRVSGPHLHWGVKVNGSWVDGFTLPLN